LATKKDTVETSANVSLVLKGVDSQKNGIHTIYAYGGAVTFKDGHAEVNADIAAKLVADGYAEEGKPEAGE